MSQRHMNQPARLAKLAARVTATAGLAWAIGLTPAAAEDDPHALHQQNCTQCHGTEVYTRADRKIQSLSSLETQVEACNTNLDAGLFPDQVKAIAGMLNDEYYKFSE
jgi:mono/diheme cytochrome c family protein